MSKQWTPLHLHGVADIPSLISKLLATLPTAGFIDHLKTRRIRTVVFRPTVSEAMLVPTADKQGFDIWLSWTNKSSVEEWLVSIGHELGHTFAYGIKLTPPLQLRWRNSYLIDHGEEEFCEQFGITWAALDGGHSALQSLLLSQLRRKRAEVLNQQNGWSQTLLDFSGAR